MSTLSIHSLNKKFWVLGCGIICCLLLYTVANALPYIPEPIGSRASMFISGTRITLLLSIGAGAIGLVVGIAFGLGKLSANLWLANFCQSIIWVLRGTPLLTQILFVYYVLPKWLPALKLNEFTSALIALALNVAAYNAEVIRGSILAIPKTQTEAGLALGLSRFTIMQRIIFPQAFKISGPALINNFIALIKDSSLASSIGLLELSLAGTRISSETFDPLPVLVTVSLIYLTLTSLISIMQFYYNLKQTTAW